jgi:3-oxoacyl-[acyl-carrier protein] reductase
MDLGLGGRVAIVAAASKGLGRAAAEELAREGAAVAICARTAADLKEAAERIRSPGASEVLWQAVAVGDASGVAGFVEGVEQRFGHVDICVINTGGPPSKLFGATTHADLRTWTDQLLMSTVYLAEQVLPRMQRQRLGVVHYHHVVLRKAARGRTVAFQFVARGSNWPGAYPSE